MLRILIDERGGEHTLRLEGRMAGEWVPVLERCWQSILRDTTSARVTAVLSDVSFIDTDGERLLERVWRAGARLQASGCRNRYIVERIQQRSASRRSAPLARL